MLECRPAGTRDIAIPTRLNLSFVASGVRNRLDTVSASKETPFLVCGTDGRLIVLEHPVNELLFIKLSDSGLMDAEGRKQFRHVWQSRLIGSFHELVSRECVYCGHVDLSSQQVGSFASVEQPEH